MSDIPVIRFSVESMRHTVMKALTEYEINITEEIKKTVEKMDIKEESFRRDKDKGKAKCLSVG